MIIFMAEPSPYMETKDAFSNVKNICNIKEQMRVKQFQYKTISKKDTQYQLWINKLCIF